MRHRPNIGEETASFAKLFELLYGIAISVMRVHALRSVEQIIGPVLVKVLLFHTVGMIGSHEKVIFFNP